MIRIGLITGEYPPDHGGVGDFTEQLARAMVGVGHQVHIVTSSSEVSEPESDPSGPASSPAGVKVHRVVDHWHFGCWRQILSLAQELRLDVLDIQYQTAAYNMHPAINLMPRKERRPPAVVTFHDLKVPYLFPKAGPLRWWAVRTLACRADGVIVTNHEDELRLSELGPRMPDLIRIPIGSNILSALPSGYDREAERARWGIKSSDLLLGYFGFLNESKGGEELIEALGLLVGQGVPAHLLKIGGRAGTSDPTNQAYAEKVDRLILDLGLKERVHWTGYVPPGQVSASLHATDVCVLPYRDGVSFRRGSLLACLAHGRAIVTTRPVAPLPGIQNGETMLLVEPENPPALARGVSRVATDPTLQARLEAGAERLATDFAWDRIAEQTAEFFAKVISESP